MNQFLQTFPTSNRLEVTENSFVASMRAKNRKLQTKT